eukprot:GGOE01044373.1.p1 GENE.GGOE01044373.1~~GGOE01044373.1.p1  ORF type:complete len:421 (-),score=134.09 GGOE01044373.1:187-1410(-)
MSPSNPDCDGAEDFDGADERGSAAEEAEEREAAEEAGDDIAGSAGGCAESDAIGIVSEEQATEARGRANQHMKDGEFEKGIDLYSAICQYSVQRYGPHAEECALHYYDYGEALLYQLQETPAGLDAAEGEDADAPALAWEALEVAMQLYTKKVEELAAHPEAGEALREAELMLATVHCKLGDLGMEGDSYPTVIGDYSKSAQLRAKHLPPGDRRLAEPHYQLGRAYELLGDLPEAVRHLNLALAVLQLDPSHAELARDVQQKVEDLEEEIQRAPVEEGQAKAMLKDALVGLVPSLGTAAAVDLSTATPLQLQAMSTAELRALAVRHGVDTADCCEKADLVDRISKSAHRLQAVAPGPACPSSSTSSSSSSSSSSCTDPARTLAPRKRVRPTNQMEEQEPPPTRHKAE